jgi:hypothetical protein
MDFGHGQNTVLGWSDPTSLPRKPWRSLQPNMISFVVLPACGAGFWMKSEKEEGEQGEDSKNYPLHFQNCQLLHPMLGQCSPS